PRLRDDDPRVAGHERQRRDPEGALRLARRLRLSPGNTSGLLRCFSPGTPMTRYLCALCQLLGALALAADAVHAQPPDPRQRGGTPAVPFRVAAGYESFALGDIASTGPPVDASQVRWVGSGPAVVAEYERSRPLRLHSVTVAVATSGGFVYETGIDSS